MPTALLAAALGASAGQAQAASMTGIATDASVAATPPTSMQSMASMIIVGTPERPLVTRGPQGPLWTLASDVAMQGVVPQGSVGGRAEPLALTTAAATKQLSKRCQTLLKKATQKLSKADRKKRQMCADQRAKRIKDSAKTGATSTGGSAGPGVSPTAPVTAAPGSTAPAATPAPSADAAPAPTPKPGATPTPTPAPTTVPAPTPDPSAACVPTGGTVTVTAYAVQSQLGVSRACATGPTVTFTYDNQDTVSNSGAGTGHTLGLQQANADGTRNTSAAKYAIYDSTVQPGKTGKPVSVANIPPGKYVLYCTIPSHSATMYIPFQVL